MQQVCNEEAVSLDSVLGIKEKAICHFMVSVISNYCLLTFPRLCAMNKRDNSLIIYVIAIL